MQFDATNVLRIGANAELRLSQLEYGRYQMELAHGVVTYRMLRATEGNIELDTPSLSVRPSRPGSFRVSVNEGGETEVTARTGCGGLYPPGSQWVRNGQSLMARGAAGDAEFQVVAAGRVDDWDRWSDSRDRVMLQSTSSRYVGPGVYGAEDMDPYGSWTQRAGIRQRLASERWTRLGALPVRPLGLGGLVWLDLGERRPLGLGSLPLRPLVSQ